MKHQHKSETGISTSSFNVATAKRQTCPILTFKTNKIWPYNI